MNHLTPTREDFADLLTDQGIKEVDYHMGEFPLVVSIEDGKVTAIVSLSDFYPDDGEVIGGVTRTLEWHARTFSGTENDPANLNRLIGAQTYLARQREYLGRIVGKAQSQKVAAEYTRRSYRDSMFLSYRLQEKTVAEANAMARVDTKRLDKEHADSIEYYTRLRALLDSVDATMIAISQERKRMAGDYERAHLTH